MGELIHADIFFMVTTAALVIVTIIAVIALVYAVAILKDIKYVSKRIKTESDEVIEDIHVLRTSIKEHGFKISVLTSLFSKFFLRKRKGKRKED
jgi:hypothetical protein